MSEPGAILAQWSESVSPILFEERTRGLAESPSCNHGPLGEPTNMHHLLFVTLPWTLLTGSLDVDPPGKHEPDAARVKQLISQLDSPKFADRQTAAKELRKIGEPAIPALSETARLHESLESRRRAEALVRAIRQDSLNRLVARLAELNSSMQGVEKDLRKIGTPAVAALQEATRNNAGFRRRVAGLLRQIEEDEFARVLNTAKLAEQKKDYSTAATILGKAIDELKAKIGDNSGDEPLLTQAFMRLAGVRQNLNDFIGAAEAYNRAAYYSNYNREKRAEIESECARMVAGLMPVWEKEVRKKIDRNPAMKKMAAKYPLILLHSRRFAGGRYLQSCYSFIYESSDEKKHFNDVQLLFDNGGGNRTFQVNMVGNQKNSVTDLGEADFEADPLKTRHPIKVAHDSETAIANHVYLEKVEDDRGNSFLVVFQVIAVDPGSRYMAFVWRRLPGGKIVRQN
jgi:hypothetical protein